VYQVGAAADPKSDYYHNINGEIDLNGAKKEDTTVTLLNSADHTVQTATYGQTLASQYGDFGLTASENANGKLQYHFQVPSGTYILKVRSGDYTSRTTLTANSVITMTYNGVTFYNDKSDHKLQVGSNRNNEDSNENTNDNGDD
jgi:hypothetical protein